MRGSFGPEPSFNWLATKRPNAFFSASVFLVKRMGTSPRMKVADCRLLATIYVRTGWLENAREAVAELERAEFF